ncbi:MAG: hypothetical protein AAF687_09920 [Pseudomonadota bacterium]
MAVHSNTFGGLRLTGEDAKKFRKQSKARKPSKAANETAKRGVTMASELLENGHFKVAEPAA